MKCTSFLAAIFMLTSLSAYAGQGDDDSCQNIDIKSMAKDTKGWTILPAFEKTIVVSTKLKSSPSLTVVKTPEEGVKMLRPGHSDALLFNRGESFEFRYPLEGRFLSGKDGLHPMVIGAYGVGSRPKLMFRSNYGFINMAGGATNLAFVSLDIEADRTTKQNPDGIRIVASGSHNILIEDVMVKGFRLNLNFDAQGVGMTNLQIRRSQILDSFSLNGDHSQGIFASNVHGLLIEESILDHNGWISRGAGIAQATIYNHNAYIQADNQCMTFRHNVSMRASATGLQARSGGIVTDNLFYLNPIQVTYGAANGDALSPSVQEIPPGVSGSLSNNIIMMGTDLSPTEPRNGLVEVGNVKHAVISGNISAHHDGVQGTGFNLRANMGVGFHNVAFQNNIVYDQQTKLTFSGQAWGPATLKTDGQGVSLYSMSGEKLVNWDQTGIKASFNGMVFTDFGTMLTNNVLQTGEKDFLTFSAPNAYVKLMSMQKAPVQFVDPSRQPSFSTLLKLRDMNKSTWDSSILAATTTWLRNGFDVK